MSNPLLTEGLVKQIEEVFRFVDRDHDKLIDKNQIGRVMRSVGLAPSQKEISEFEKQVQDKIDSTTMVEICGAFLKKHANDPPHEKKLEDAFKVLDQNNSGSVWADDLRHVLTSVGEMLSNEEVDKLFAQSGVKNDDYLSFEQFKQMFTIKRPQDYE